MKTIEILLGIFGWLFIGWLFAFLKTRYWHNFLIKKEYASKYADFHKTPLKISIPICIIWPLQSLCWLTQEIEKRPDGTIPITPLGVIGETETGNRSNQNYAILNNESTYWYHSSYFAGRNEEINESDLIKWHFGSSVLLGGLNLFFWALGVACWILALLVTLIVAIVGLCITLLSYTTVPIKSETKKDSVSTN